MSDLPAADPIVAAADRLARTTETALDDRPSAEAVPPPGTVPAPVAVRRGRTASAVAMVGLLGFFAIFGLVRARRSTAIDLAVTYRLQARNHAVIRWLMTAASWPGFSPQSLIIPSMAIAGLWARRLRLEALAVAGGWGTALLSSVVKGLMRRPRPVADARLQVVAARLGGSSFPSGHVITYMGVYGALAYLAGTLIRPARLRRAAVGGLVALIAAVGPSRIYQGHHWPTDVTASYLLGSAYLVGLTSLYRRVKARRAAVRD